MQGTRPPRLLISGYKNSEVIGPPNEREAQVAVLRAALNLLASASAPGALVDLPKRF